MKKSAAGRVTFLLGISSLVWMLATASVFAASSPVPPKNLKKVGDHWTPWDPPPAGPQDYLIQKGDTLWDLAERWLGDPFLWPQVWDENRYILDSHWIYPGDPLVIPGRPTVVPPEGPGPDTEAEVQVPPIVEETEEPVIDAGYGRGEEESPDARVPVPMPAPLLPVADPGDLYCSGFIEPEYVSPEFAVVGGELEREHFGQGNVVYVNRGTNQGVQAGTELAIRRPTRDVRHPVSKAELGTYVRRLGKLRIIAVQENTSTALIEDSCEDIVAGDQLVAWEDIPIPMRSDMPPFDRYDVTPSGGSEGYIVAVQDEVAVVGSGHVVQVDLGAGSEAEPGDVITVFRDNGDLPRLMLGQAVILTVEPSTSTAKIMTSTRESTIGDRVEIIP